MMKELKTENLFLVHPSKVIKVDTFNISKSKECDIITFEKNINDISAACFCGDSSLEIYNNITNNGDTYKSFPTHYCSKEDFYVHVTDADILKLREYLYYKTVSKIPLKSDLDKYILELKPFYTTYEIEEALKQYKEEMLKNTTGTIKIFKRQINYKKEDKNIKHYYK